MVYLMTPSELSLDDLAHVAVVLGVDAEFEEQLDGTLFAEETFLTPAGPVTMELDSAALSLGILSSSLAPACLNGVDDDGDGAIDDFDTGCFTSLDDNEAEDGLQEQDPEERGILEGQIDEDGVLNITTLHLGEMSATLPADGGLLEGSVSLDSGTGLVDVSEGLVDISLNLELALLCSGEACSFDSCTAGMALSLASDDDQGFGYGPDTGTATVAGPIALSPGDCGEDLSDFLSLEDGDGFARLAMRLDPIFDRATRRLTFDAVSGRVGLVATHVDELTPAEPSLPTEEEAVQMAWEIAEALQLDLPGAHEVSHLYREDINGDGEVQEVGRAVRLEAHLDVAVWEGLQITGHVDGGEVDVVFGHEGRILGFGANWRNVTPFETVPLLRRAELVAYAGELLLEAEPDLPVEGLQYSLHYSLGGGHHGGTSTVRNYLTPEWAVQTPSGEHLLSFPASDFRPEVLVVESPEGEADGSAPIGLAVEISGGTEPYTIDWVSNLDGHLGSSESIEVWLSNGAHVVKAQVSDANGAIQEANAAFVVDGALVDPENDEERGYGLGNPSHGTQIVASVRVGPGGVRQISPLVRVTTAQGRLASEHWWEEWRYTLFININGSIYKLRSGRCIPGVYSIDVDGSWKACSAPMGSTGEGQAKKHFSEIDKANYVQAGPNQSQSKMVVENLPGRMVLRAPWASGDYYAGDAGVAPPFGIVTQPGLKPTSTWQYIAPEGGVPCQEIVDFCQQNDGVDPISGNKWCDIPERLYDPDHPDYEVSSDICCEGDETYQVDDVETILTMAVEPRGGNDGAYATFLQDRPWNGSFPPIPPSTAVRTNGSLGECIKTYVLVPGIPPRHVSPEPGDTFCTMDPMRNEAGTTVVSNGTVVAGGWDNLHLKGRGPWNVVFPFGNFANTRILTGALQQDFFDPWTLPFDRAPTVHYHQDWWAGVKSFDVGGGKTVRWYVTKGSLAEARTTNSKMAANYMNGERIFYGENTPNRLEPSFSAGGPGAPFGDRSTGLVRAWMTSRAKRGTCGRGITACRNFSAPFFFTPSAWTP